MHWANFYQDDGLMQERRISIANALELRVSSIIPSKTCAALAQWGVNQMAMIWNAFSGKKLFFQ